MGLAQGIVIVNEYTINNNGQGSRGSTPGDYVSEYMSRNGATETLTPVRLLDQEDYITRYMAREEAVEGIEKISRYRSVDKNDVKSEFRDIQGNAGVAFGYGSVSMSDEKLKYASRDIQKQFDDGKTILKTVLSFDEQYLRDMGIIPEDFVCQKPGDFRGHIDQMKLRLGIMHGLDSLSKDYDDLQYVGVIQVDTMHVHCHLAMVDRGEGNIMPDGTQRGKITAAQKTKLRRNIDMYLDETKSIQHMSSNVSMDKRNTSMFIKRVSHKTMQQNGLAQLLLACLPEDKRLWRASTNSKSMEKANGLARSYVQELFAQPDSGYDKVQRSIYEYAEMRRNKEDLSGEEFRKLIKDGERRVENECINGVYSMLQNVRSRDMRVHTPMLDLMAMPAYDVAKDADDFGEFTYKLRSYNTRLDYHKKERDKAHSINENYETAYAQGNVSDDARPIYDFFKFEEDYNEKLMCKYQHFLHFLPPSDKYRDELRDLLNYRQRLNDVDAMYHDRSIRRMKEQNAEDYGERVYHQRGGSYMVTMPEVIETRLVNMRDNLAKKDRDFAYKIASDALSIDWVDDKPSMKRDIKHDFEDVKALDIHHLAYDSPYDIYISKHNADTFVEAANKRYELAQAAREYLIASGQQSELDSINMRDIRLMKKVADNMGDKPEIKSQRADDGSVARVKTTDLGVRFDMSIAVRQSLRELQMEDEEESASRRRYGW